MRRGVAIEVVLVVLFVASCGGNSPHVNSNGRVSGHALAGPTCPVEQPGVLDCEPKPVQGNAQFAQGDHIVKSVRIDAAGEFAIEIPAGKYTVTVDTGDNIFPMCQPVEVEVRTNADSVVEILCDTGIR
jgi:hypothetical protein